MAIPCCAIWRSVSTCDHQQVVLNEEPSSRRLGSHSRSSSLTRQASGVSQTTRRYSQYPGKPGINTINYGEGPKKLAKTLGCTVAEAKEKIIRYFQPYPQVREFIDNVHDIIADMARVETILGRPRRLVEMLSLGKVSRRYMSGRERANLARNERQSVNSIIQGSSADIAKAAMLNCEYSGDLRDLGVQMLLQIHDELIFEIPEENAAEAMPIIQDLMEHPLDRELLVPLTVDGGTGPSWNTAKA